MGSIFHLIMFLMCGRTSCTLAPDDILRACSYRDRNGRRRRPAWKVAPGGQRYQTSYNMAPGSFTPVLVSGKHFKPEEVAATSTESSEAGSSVDPVVVMPMKWGLVPKWHKGDSPSKVAFKTSNCRGESMLEKATFKTPLQQGRRCVVLMDGFYEWKTTPSGKQPHYFHFSPHGDEKTVLEESSTSKVKLEEKTIKMEKDASVENIQPLDAFKEKCNNLLIKQAVEIKPEKTPDCEKMKMKYEKPFTPIAADRNTISSSSSSSGRPTNGNNNKQEREEESENKLVLCPPTTRGDCCSTPQPPGGVSVKQEGGQHLDDDEVENAILRSIADDAWDDDDDLSVDCVDRRLLTCAAVYDVWQPSATSPPLYSYSIITVAASKDMAWCHHRMPAVLSTDEEVCDWLDFSSIPLAKAKNLIQSKEDCLTSHAVSKKVNNSHYQASDCITPVDLATCHQEDKKRKLSGSGKLMMGWLKKPLQPPPSSSNSKDEQDSPAKKTKI